MKPTIKDPQGLKMAFEWATKEASITRFRHRVFFNAELKRWCVSVLGRI